MLTIDFALGGIYKVKCDKMFHDNKNEWRDGITILFSAKVMICDYVLGPTPIQESERRYEASFHKDFRTTSVVHGLLNSSQKIWGVTSVFRLDSP